MSVIMIVGGFGVSMAQGKLQFLNGKEKRYMVAEVKGEHIVYQPEGKPDSFRKRADRFSVFSIIPDKGSEMVVYSPDTTDGLEPTIQEARDFIGGEKLAERTYRKPMNFVGGFCSGLAGGFLGYYGPPVPFAYAAITGRYSPELPSDSKDQNHSEAFIAGYQKKARNMKIKNSLLGGGLGFVVGFSTLFLLFN